MILLKYPDGATPIDGDELQALIPNINLQHELNQFERDNIREAMRWAEKSRKLRHELLSVNGIKLLHQSMFGNVWRWAGKFRTTQKNIGNVEAHQVAEEVHKLCQDLGFQIEQGIENWELLAVTFHYRLVSIHPFPNGNGRHARLAANLLLQYNKKQHLPWGVSDLMNEAEIRKEYLQALKEADLGNLNPLLKFAMKEDH